MSDSTDTDVRRPVITYIVIAIALVASLILCVWWAKSRANSYTDSRAQSGQNQSASTGSEGSQPATTETPSQQSQPATENAQSSQAPTQVGSTGPSLATSVPSTGPEQLVTPVIATSVIAFAAQSYLRSRRRLRSLAR